MTSKPSSVRNDPTRSLMSGESSTRRIVVIGSPARGKSNSHACETRHPRSCSLPPYQADRLSRLTRPQVRQITAWRTPPLVSLESPEENRLPYVVDVTPH